MRFLLFLEAGSLVLGRIVTEADRSYQQHDGKPLRTSSSLPTRLSRALVNLVAPCSEVIVDPCCGTGSILLEAEAVGLQAFGGDWNPRMVEMSRLNLSHFGYRAQVDLVDARVWDRRADAIVTDLPYGRGLEVSEDVLQGILLQALTISPVSVFVVGADMSPSLRAAGFRSVETYRVPKSRRFSRYVHRAWR